MTCHWRWALEQKLEHQAETLATKATTLVTMNKHFCNCTPTFWFKSCSCALFGYETSLFFLNTDCKYHYWDWDTMVSIIHFVHICAALHCGPSHGLGGPSRCLQLLAAIVLRHSQPYHALLSLLLANALRVCSASLPFFVLSTLTTPAFFS